VKAVTLLSGGKDSFLSALIASESGMELEYALIILPEEESPMFHVPNIGNAKLVAKLLSMDIVEIRESEFDRYFAKMRDQGVKAVVSGAAASDYQHTRIQRLCSAEGMLSFSPLWRIDPYIVLNELLLRRIDAMIVSVSAEGMDEGYLGRRIDESFISDIMKVEKRFGVNPLGEGGEYESFVTGMPGRPKIRIIKANKNWSGSGGYLELSCVLEDS